jgi:transcriptional regulator with XRE-family HTH domain
MAIRTLERAVGGELKRRREAQGLRQDAIAHAAELFGFNWTQSTVAAIEAGRRRLSIGEFGALPMIFAQAGLFIACVVEFFPDTDESVIVAPGIEAPLNRIRSLYGTREGAAAAPAWEPRILLAAASDAERKAARVLRISPDALLRLAVDRWGHTLAAERDRRIGVRAATLSRRSLQAVRGRVTRELLDELKPRKRTGKRRK